MLSFIKSIGILEGSLFQILFYVILWTFNEYLALLLTFIIVPILLAVYIISFISERLEKSNVPSNYFKIILISAIIPVVVAIVFIGFFNVEMFWNS